MAMKHPHPIPPTHTTPLHITDPNKYKTTHQHTPQRIITPVPDKLWELLHPVANKFRRNGFPTPVLISAATLSSHPSIWHFITHTLTNQLHKHNAQVSATMTMTSDFILWVLFYGCHILVRQDFAFVQGKLAEQTKFRNIVILKFSFVSWLRKICIRPVGIIIQEVQWPWLV